jgi:hypothetical protein
MASRCPPRTGTRQPFFDPAGFWNRPSGWRNPLSRQKIHPARKFCDFPISSWRQLRDQQLLTRSQLVLDLATTAASGPQAADAAKYGITAAAVANLTKERADYAEIVNAPGVAQAVRKALTRGFRPAFALVERKFNELDSLILQFGGTTAGRSMIATWKHAHFHKGANAPNPTPAPAPPAPTA